MTAPPHSAAAVYVPRYIVGRCVHRLLPRGVMAHYSLFVAVCMAHAYVSCGCNYVQTPTPEHRTLLTEPPPNARLDLRAGPAEEPPCARC